jgi:hypothetical protein
MFYLLLCTPPARTIHRTRPSRAFIHAAEVDTPVLKAAGASVVLSEGMAELEGLLQ